MKKRTFIIATLATLVILLPLSAVFAADVYLTKTELIQWDPDKAYEGYNLFVNNNVFWLVDMEGQVVHSWAPVGTGVMAGFYSFLMENGHLRSHETPSTAPGGAVAGQGGSQGRIAEYDWDGNRVWYMDVFDYWDKNKDGVINEDDQLESKDFFGNVIKSYVGTYRFHHDAQRMFNKKLNKWTYIVLCWIGMSEADADQMGVAADQKYRSRDTAGTGAATWSPCALLEILPDYTSGVGGDIIWYWTFADHMITMNPAGDPILDRDTETWVNWGGNLSRPPLVVSNEYGAADSIEAHPELLDVNGMHYYEPGGPNVDYQHCNSIDYNEDLGYIAINAKACNEFFVIDHDGTFDTTATANNWDSVGALARSDKGNFLYRYGNPANYKSGEPAKFYNEGDMEMYGTHDIQWIMDYAWRPPMVTGDNWTDPADYGSEFELPGAGHFMMFDNGCYNPMNAGSKILEVNPYLKGDGTEETATYADGNTKYVWMATGLRTYDPTDARKYTQTDSVNNPTGLKRRGQLVWSHPSEFGGGFGAGDNINDFYSSYISSAMRMPNGNTIIDAGARSHFFEVTSDNKVVWEYVMPPYDNVSKKYTSTKQTANMCFRFHRYPAEHPALKGRDLTPGNTLTGLVPATLDSGAGESLPVSPPAPKGWGSSSVVFGEGGGGDADGGGGGGGGGY
jgi:hypothetical protein